MAISIRHREFLRIVEKPVMIGTELLFVDTKTLLTQPHLPWTRYVVVDTDTVIQETYNSSDEGQQPDQPHTTKLCGKEINHQHVCDPRGNFWQELLHGRRHLYWKPDRPVRR